VDLGIGPAGSIVGLNDNDWFSAWLSITKHLQQPLGIAIILHRNCPPDSPTLGQDPHLDQVGLLAQDLLDEITDYPYDSEGPDANSKVARGLGSRDPPMVGLKPSTSMATRFGKTDGCGDG